MKFNNLYESIIKEEKIKIFAYGSNMEPKQMKERCPSASLLCKGTLLNHEVVFDIWSDHWKGGVANLKKKMNAEVLGIVWEITKKDLPSLDHHEDVKKNKAKSKYQRITLPILLSFGNTENCFVYMGKPGGTFDPSIDYKFQLLKGRTFRDTID